MAASISPSLGSQMLELWRNARQQKDACVLLDLGNVSYHLIERGKRKPTALQAIRIEKLTGVTVESWYEKPSAKLQRKIDTLRATYEHGSRAA